MLSKKSKIKQLAKSHENRFLAASAAASLGRTCTKFCGRLLDVECTRALLGVRFAKWGGRGDERQGRLWSWHAGLNGRSRLAAVRDMFSGMSIDIRFEPTDFSVVVKSRGKPPNPWRWEIYRAGRSNAVEQSAVFFPTMAAANKAGKEALAEVFKKLQGRALE
jgi:hypothetical protein